MNSSAKVVEKATQILAAIDSHVNDKCEHCMDLLKSAGLAAQPDDISRTTTTTQRALNHEEVQ
jgi:hypothetical protein